MDGLVPIGLGSHPVILPVLRSAKVTFLLSGAPRRPRPWAQIVPSKESLLARAAHTEPHLALRERDRLRVALAVRLRVALAVRLRDRLRVALALALAAAGGRYAHCSPDATPRPLRPPSWT